MHRNNELQNKIVIDIHTANRIGKVTDIDVDVLTGQIKSLIVLSSDLFSLLFPKNKEVIVEWKNIVCIGDEFILVDIKNTFEISIKE